MTRRAISGHRSRRGGTGNESQLTLSIDPPAQEPPSGIVVPARLRPMQPVAGAVPFDDPDWFFEPVWPGTRMLATLSRGRTSLQIEHLSDPALAFPDLRDLAAHVPDAEDLVLDGMVLVLDDSGRPDERLLHERLSRASSGTSSVPGEAAFVASDLLFDRDRSWLEQPFEARRQHLIAQVADSPRCVVNRGLAGEGITLAAAAASMGLTTIWARHRAGGYEPGTRSEHWRRIGVSEQPAPERRPFLVLLNRLPL